ncbi:MAG TPA: L-ribulose-5-phosphate 4-epimerase [Candidatus Pullichristensenella excrementigallinarum]|uniref:L-ribulose-5-phosphate 4-epimerase n=1 Tax=Candidatus Pullichristensenella excrementigallinarum TaxID=2840907 RepID=A0A9D1LC25_9FIRM|nr:L-ribulose-5-phosphate 4-epimerase [Candidatus Pullichristensenella excrementigallinarum]
MANLQKEVYDANMELVRRNLIIYTWGNVSGIDREQGIVAIKPSGVEYDELTPEMIVLVSLETGKVLEGTLRPSSDTPTHLKLYRAFPEIGGVTHTHSTCATAWAQAGLPIPCMGTTHADYFHGDIPVTRFLTPQETEEAYEGNTGTVIIEAFQGKNPIHTPGVLCAGHGPFTWGKTPAQSVYHAVVLEEVAKMGLMARSLQPGLGALPQHISDKHFLRKHGPNAYYGQN